MRQGFLGSVSFADTWPGFAALAGLIALLSALALREMQRITADNNLADILRFASGVGGFGRHRVAACAGA